MRYRTKPFEIEAKQYHHGMDEFYDMQRWCGTHRSSGDEWDIPNFDNVQNWWPDAEPDIVAVVWDKLHDTWVGVKDGQYIIKGMKGEFYPCDPDVFKAKYEPVSPYQVWHV